MKEIRYDKDADALIIVFSDEKVAYEEEINEDELIVGFSENRELVWLEILDASKGFSAQNTSENYESGVRISV